MSQKTNTVTIDPRHLLNLILEGEPTTVSALEELTQLDEGQFLEFKDGLLTQKPRWKEGRIELRRAINGFANSTGGILVIGVSNSPPRRISPCRAQPSEPLDKWTENLFMDMAPRLSPPPRVEVIQHKKGPVVLIAIPRASQIASCINAGRSEYHFRVNQSTIESPEYLVSDLILGHRRHPSLELRLDGIGFSITGVGFDLGIEDLIPGGASKPMLKCRLTFYLEVSNAGLVYAEHVIVGMVTWCTSSQQSGPLNGHLRTYLELIEPRHTEGGMSLSPVHLRAEPYPEKRRDLEPFASRMFQTNEDCRLPLGTYEIDAAVYLLARGSEPSWYQLRFRPPVDDTHHQGRLENVTLEGPVGGRARVSCEPLP